MKTRRVDPANTTPDSFGDLPLFAQGPTELDQALANVSKAVKPSLFTASTPSVVREAGRILSLYKRGLPVPEKVGGADVPVEACRFFVDEQGPVPDDGEVYFVPANITPAGTIAESAAHPRELGDGQFPLVRSPFHWEMGTVEGSIAVTSHGLKFTPAETSAEAMASITSHLPTLEHQVLEAIRAAGPKGACCHELEKSLGMPHTTCSARITGLQRKCQIMASGETRPTPSGRKAIVWIGVE